MIHVFILRIPWYYFVSFFHLFLLFVDVIFVGFFYQSVDSIMSIGSLRCLTKSRKYGEYSVCERLVQLYANANFCMWSFHLFLWRSGKLLYVIFPFTFMEFWQCLQYRNNSLVYAFYFLVGLDVTVCCPLFSWIHTIWLIPFWILHPGHTKCYQANQI